MAFAYLTWLFALSFIVVVATVVGQVIATDDGRLGGCPRSRRCAAARAVAEW